jgi:hypothetical protein
MMAADSCSPPSNILVNGAITGAFQEELPANTVVEVRYYCSKSEAKQFGELTVYGGGDMQTLHATAGGVIRMGPYPLDPTTADGSRHMVFQPKRTFYENGRPTTTGSSRVKIENLTTHTNEMAPKGKWRVWCEDGGHEQSGHHDWNDLVVDVVWIP